MVVWSEKYSSCFSNTVYLLIKRWRLFKTMNNWSLKLSLQIRVSLSVEAKNYLLDKTEENSNICVEIQK